MNTNLIPFNIDLLIPGHIQVKDITPVTTSDILEGSSRNFHPRGLFSTEIFGKVGDERRNRRYSYIDLKAPIIHPIIYKALTDVKRLYGEIMAGTSYAVWDDKLKDYVKSSAMDGNTGYQYFLEHLNEIVFENKPSIKREFNIKLILKYRDNCLMHNYIVMPAGLRDIQYDAGGRPIEDEINTLYRRLLALSNLITPTALKTNPEALDAIRYNIQIKANEIYDYIKSMIEGKKKMLLGKWATRKIFDGTRNVITSLIDDVDELDSPLTVDYNQTVLGLFQYIKSIRPLALYQIRNGFISRVFPSTNTPAVLVNKETLKQERVSIDPSYYDEWLTDEGLEKIINKFAEEDVRHTYLSIGNHWLGLIYKGPDGTYCLMQDIDDLPPDRDKRDVHPITFAELLYLSVYQGSDTIPTQITRYPVAGYGGIYPSFVYLKTTVKSEIRKELDQNFKPTGNVAIQFPIRGEFFVNSMSPHHAHIAKLGADYDGDMCSANSVYSEEAKEEVKNVLSKASYYVDTDGRLHFSGNSDTVKLVLSSITG